MRFLTDDELRRVEESHPEMSEKCPTCRGKGYYLWQGKKVDCDCAGQRRLNVLYSHAGIGLTYQRLDWADLRQQDSAHDQRIVDYLANAEDHINRGIGLILTGPLGTGKTLILNLILKTLVKKSYDCYVTTFAETIDQLTATWGDNDEKARFAKRFMRSRVLGIDDIGKEFRSRNNLAESTFDHILRVRVQESRPTFITTNMTAGELHTGYGAAVFSLLMEKCIGIDLRGSDFRSKALFRELTEISNHETRPII